MQNTKPDVRPLGALALGFAILSVLLSVTYFLSPLAYLAAVLALGLGLVSRSDERTRRMGNAAIVLTLIAIVAASATLFWV